MSKDWFLADGKTQRAVIEGLIVIGEAGNTIMQLDPSLQEAHSALWQQSRNAYEMRIILTHEYFRVDASVVWTRVQDHLPVLKAQLIESGLGDNSPSPPGPRTEWRRLTCLNSSLCSRHDGRRRKGPGASPGAGIRGPRWWRQLRLASEGSRYRLPRRSHHRHPGRHLVGDRADRFDRRTSPLGDQAIPQARAADTTENRVS